MIIEKVQKEVEEHFSISEFLAQKLHKDYGSVSRLFSEVEAVTVEQFFILQKIEKVKELLTYDELTLSQIAWRLDIAALRIYPHSLKKLQGLLQPYLRLIISTAAFNRFSL